jgi:endonuclease-8
VPEGDTIHRAAERINLALGGKAMERAEAPNPRSPLHRRAGELQGSTLELAEARGKHLLVHFSGDLVFHTHLGMNGRVRVAVDGRLPGGRPWLVLASGRSVAAQSGGKLLRLVTESRARNDPALLRLGPDPLRPGFDVDAAARRLRERGRGRAVGEVLLDQGVIAGIGNAIRNEACFVAGISPWRPVDELGEEEARLLVAESERVMRTSIARGRRPRSIYRAASRRCPGCGGAISSRGQGDDNRTAYWCPTCQR